MVFGALAGVQALATSKWYVPPGLQPTSCTTKEFRENPFKPPVVYTVSDLSPVTAKPRFRGLQSRGGAARVPGGQCLPLRVLRLPLA